MILLTDVMRIWYKCAVTLADWLLRKINEITEILIVINCKEILHSRFYIRMPVVPSLCLIKRDLTNLYTRNFNIYFLVVNSLVNETNTLRAGIKSELRLKILVKIGVVSLPARSMDIVLDNHQSSYLV